MNALSAKTLKPIALNAIKPQMPFRGLGFGFWGLAALFILLAVPARAADVCCTCHQTDPTKNSCLTTDPAKLLKATDCSSLPTVAKMPDGWTCDTRVLQTNDPKCASIPNNGICQSDPKSALSLSGEAVGIKTNAKPLPDISFSLGVPIPGFTAPEDLTDLFSTYLVAIFRYLISIVAVVTTIMFIYGAFRYLVGSSLGSVSRGKEIMVDAVIGMLLMLSATMILRTVNPALTTLKSLAPTDIETVVYANPYAGIETGPGVLTELGFPPGAQARVPDYAIPLECPGRSPSATGPGQIYALSYKGTTLTSDVINQYLDIQRATGIPAAVIIAQMMTETGGAGKCIALNLFKNPSICSQSAFVKYFNFGGVGCTQRQVPSNACAHLAFDGPAGIGAAPGKGNTITLDKSTVNAYWNKTVSPTCVSLLNEGATRETYKNCGEQCFPLKSHTTVRGLPGQTKEVWIPTVQCSRKFANAKEFLAAHEKAISACLPYNDSVYSFAYCIGASMYASTGMKATTLADIIERNCLCDPERDSRKCVRDKALEEDIRNAVVKKTNLFNLYSAGKLDEAAQDKIVKMLYEKTGGRLIPLPMDDPDMTSQ